MANPVRSELITIPVDSETRSALERAAPALRSVRVRLSGEATVSTEGPELMGEHLVLGRHAVHPTIEVLSDLIASKAASVALPADAPPEVRALEEENEHKARRRLRGVRDQIHKEAHARGWA